MWREIAGMADSFGATRIAGWKKSHIDDDEARCAPVVRGKSQIPRHLGRIMRITRPTCWLSHAAKQPYEPGEPWLMGIIFRSLFKPQIIFRFLNRPRVTDLFCPTSLGADVIFPPQSISCPVLFSFIGMQDHLPSKS